MATCSSAGKHAHIHCDNANGNANPNYAHLLVYCTEIFLGTKLYNGHCACHQIVLRLPQCHTATYHSLHQPPRATLQRYQGLQSTAPATECHTGAAPATQSHTATVPCTSHPEPRSNATRMLQSTAPATKCHTGAAPATQRHNSTYHSLHQPPRPTLQRYQGLQSTAPATKCHTGAAPATQRHTATHPSLHQPPRATLQRYQDASIDCACHQMSHWCCACHTTSQFNVPFPAPATQTHTPTLPGTSIDCACHQMSPATQRHTATHPSLHQPPRATLQRYQDASITCHQMSHWCCACHTTSHCNVHATYHSLHQPPRATLQRYQDASIDCACHQMSHWCCACHTTSQFNVPFPAPATQIRAATGSVPTCTSEPISHVQASQFHVYKRTNFTCTSEPAPIPGHSRTL